MRRWPTIARNSPPNVSVFGVNRRCRGNSHTVASAKEKATTEDTTVATRHPPNSSTTDGMMRPSNPPTVVPATYRPMMRGTCCGWTSSDTYVMATAGTPAMITPCTRRMPISAAAPGASASVRPSTVASTAPMRIIGRRPKRSDSTDIGMIAQARPPVVADTVSAAVAGLMPRSSVSTGNSACVAYSAWNDAMPANSTATSARRNPGSVGVRPGGTEASVREPAAVDAGVAAPADSCAEAEGCTLLMPVMLRRRQIFVKCIAVVVFIPFRHHRRWVRGFPASPRVPRRRRP